MAEADDEKLMKYPLKAKMPLDRDGKLPSDEAWERTQRFIAQAQMRIAAKKELPQPSTEKLAEAANKWLVPNMQKKPKKEE